MGNTICDTVAAQRQEGPTAGLRNAQWALDSLPTGTTVGVHPLQTHDGASCTGFLYTSGASETVICIMHPREFLATHYLVPPIIEAGYAVWTQTPRSVGNDLRLEHERALLDVAAGQTKLRALGFRKIVLLGNSGGASLFSFYNQQALMAPEARLTEAPGGRRVDLAGAEMPPPDLFAFVSPHPGQGAVLMKCIDPSVTDEDDPLLTDPTLDPFDPANGFCDPPESATYAPVFQERYKAAQKERVRRLDTTAHELIAARLAARRRAKDGGTIQDKRRGAWQPVMTVWRTDADLRNFDLSIDPSDRKYGSVWGKDPFASNFGNVGFARQCAPEAWLSTWSGLSSGAEMAKTAPSIEQPTLFIDYTGDTVSFPGDMDAIYGAIATRQKHRLRFRGDHHGRALDDGEPAGRTLAGDALGEWLREKS
jgi:hypothetical protein